ncbi:MAG: response regulator transcription factor [Dehalococcoidia bacterium]
MLRLVIIGDETEETTGLCSALVEKGLACSIVPMGQDAGERGMELAPSLVLLHLKDPATCVRADGMLRGVKEQWRVPVIALLSEETARALEASAAIDDFVISPWDAAEVGLRSTRILARISAEENRGKRIACGDLTIYVDSCEVTVGGMPIALTFREYELLRFLASNRGRVFSREDLLSQVWGYDYLGGGRTVDVHIRRLRSKIEDSGHIFVETVRNVGYRFTKDI